MNKSPQLTMSSQFGRGGKTHIHIYDNNNTKLTGETSWGTYMWEIQGRQGTPSLWFQKRIPREKVGLGKKVIRNRVCKKGNSVTMTRVQ